MKIQKIKIENLMSDPANVRLHDKKNLRAIKSSLKKFGQQKPIVIDSDHVVIAGNGTLEAAIGLGWGEINCVMTDLDSTDKTAFAIADNRTGELASWDDKALGAMLSKLEFEGFNNEDIGFDADDINDMFSDMIGSQDGENKTDEPYTRKIDAPIYEPTGEKPNISTLLDTSKSDALLKDIAESDLDGDLKDFLSNAAMRHVEFNYREIAEFYAHADAKTQDLMERSALVIIDFNKAIENGFVKLSNDLAEAYRDERN